MAIATADGAVDMDTGLGALFGILAAVFAAVTLFLSGIAAAIGFGGAVLFAALTVVAIHVYE